MEFGVKQGDHAADFDDNAHVFYIAGDNGDDCLEIEEEQLVLERGEKVFLSRSQLRRMKRDKLRRTLRKDVC
jgi:hypothetical protein